MLANMDELCLNRMMVAAKIADAMRSSGMNQKQLAQKMGKTESEVSEWLSKHDVKSVSGKPRCTHLHYKKD